jgi:glycerol-3-phosphate dehydrogenase
MVEKVFDVLILGGGATGAGILRDCALRGLKACLVEKGELGRATTANSSHLIHGGLRYLLYDRFETHLSSWDSGHILRTAGPLLRRLPIVWPVYRGHQHGLETVETLLQAYDRFQVMKGGRPHLRLSAEDIRAIFPEIRPEGLLGGLSFDEWWVDPAGLVRTTVESAQKRQAEARIHCEATALLVDNGRVIGVRLRYKGTGREETVKAKIVVNATGPWANQTAALAGCSVPLRLRQGTHLVYAKLPFRAGLLVEAPDRERYVFVLPFGPVTLVGPTDIPCSTSPDALKPEGMEVRYLLDSMKRYFPAFPERFDRLLCGARPILAQASDEKLLSRDYEIFDHEKREGIPGFVTIAGGKLSSFRKMAEDLTDVVCAKLGKNLPCRTHLETLWGEPVKDIPDCSLPPARIKSFLNRHPRLREFYALSFLGLEFAKHIFRRNRSRAGFFEHYGLK